jgi:O-antigen ligase
MALSLILTMSRSGISALAVALALSGFFVLRGMHGRSRKALGAAYLLLLALTIVGWIGADTIVTRFSKVDWSEFNNRRGAWADAVNVAAAYPFAGTGLNTYGTVALFYQRHDLEKHFGEAHNDYLQLVAEGGLLVGLPIVLCLVFFGREVWRQARGDEPGSTSWWVRRGAITALVAIALQETVEFSLQMPGNAALFAVVCAFALHRPSVRPQAEPAPQRPPGEVTPFPVVRRTEVV